MKRLTHAKSKGVRTGAMEEVTVMSGRQVRMRNFWQGWNGSQEAQQGYERYKVSEKGDGGVWGTVYLEGEWNAKTWDSRIAQNTAELQGAC